jgi:SAM-dependent methyltransferase
MEWYEVAFDRMYPVLYDYRDIDEAIAVVDRFGPRFAGKAPVVDLASGSGRYLQALLRHGIETYGLDLSHYLLRRSIEEWGHDGRIVQGDMRHLPFSDESVEGVWNMFTSFGYFSVDTDNLLVLKEVHRILKPGGLFLFDFLNAGRLSVDQLETTERQTGEYTIVEKKRLESHGKFLVKHVVATDGRTGRREEVEERLRLYSRDELKIMFTSAGFAIEESCGDYLGNPFVESVSERVILLGSK